MSVDRMFSKKAVVTKAFLLYLTSGVLKVWVVGELPDVCTSCHANATCEDKMDGSGGKVCNCMYGFLGNGRTQCLDKDECEMGADKICGDHTVCHNTYGSFYCTCLSGYSPSNNLVIFIPNDGTHCNDIDECRVQGICGEGGRCRNVQGDFNCLCQVGYKVQNGSEPFHPHRDKAFCKAIDCGQLPSIPNAALLSVKGTRYGSIAKFGCLEGFFQKSGHDSAVCGATGVWEGPSLVCEEIDCGEPPALPNSVTVWNKGTTVGTVVYYECRGGFYNAGHGNFSVCTTSGRWDGASILCEEIECGDPPVLPHSGWAWNGSTNLGSTVYYYCNEGFYHAGGESVSLCIGNGYWTKSTLQCKEIDCGDPPALPHSVMVWNKGTIVGTVVHYECDAGFYNAGNVNVSICTAEGYWTHPNILCQEIDCGEPPALPHSVMMWNKSTTVGSVVYYECEDGFHAVGGWSVSVCMEHGYWDNATLLCQEINCGPPTAFPNTDMHWDGTTGLGSVVRYTCKHGYYQEGGGSQSTCTSAREWEHITVTCRANCGPVPSLPHTDVAWQNGSVAGSVALHRCRSGYRSRRGTGLSVCMDTGDWLVATMLCREIKPAISKPVVFNEKCLRWKAEIYDGDKEDYMVQFVGSREYQRMFQDKRKRVFSSTADWPELCLNLLPGTNYTINITAQSARFSSIIIANTSIQVPQVPEVVFRDVETPLPSLWLRRSINTLDPISVYQVFVVPLEGTMEFDCRSPSTPHFHGLGEAHGLYVAAQMRVEEIGSELSFTVGDQSYYGGYYNAPLEPGKDYYIILRVVNQWGKVKVVI
ncbi:sushi domain-containing protein 1 isoform X2 [Megalops cyprinoides]|uniref:sushi domain-containing protein 1 isoform X2 n=1 Tax=Megalops cyprinoides TaxID=118141 RepID=UPI001863EEE4|nr:sushi domain-containing protein 1 isoform X2 [Megalops cyprinoides]